MPAAGSALGAGSEGRACQCVTTLPTGLAVRTRNLEPALDLSAYEGLELRLKGDGRRYKLIVRTDPGWDTMGAWRAAPSRALDWMVWHGGAVCMRSHRSVQSDRAGQTPVGTPWAREEAAPSRPWGCCSAEGRQLAERPFAGARCDAGQALNPARTISPQATLLALTPRLARGRPCGCPSLHSPPSCARGRSPARRR